MGKFRIENDSLGPVEVPSGALYSAQTTRAIKNFSISGRVAHPELIVAYLQIKWAAALANERAQKIKKEISKAISESAQEILLLPESEWRDLFPVDPYQAGAGTSQNMNVNEVLANFANRKLNQPLGSNHPVHPNDDVNCSQSTNDTYPTAMRLAILASAKELKIALEKLSEEFAKKAEAWANLPKSARTHLQDAVPMRLGQEFSAYAKTISKMATFIEHGREKLRELGIGGSAAGTGLNVPKGFAENVVQTLAKLTGEKLRLADHLGEAMQSQAPASFYSSMLRVTALELTRICNDLRLLASGPLTGLAEIQLPAVQPGSSIMPGKVNPSVLEMANQTWFSVLGYDQTVAYAMQAGQLELNVMMPIIAYSLLEATRIATRATETLRTFCIEGLTANEARLRHYFESTPQVATALTPRLGYEVTAGLVQESLKSGKSVLQLVREKALIPEAELEALIDVRTLTGT